MSGGGGGGFNVGNLFADDRERAQARRDYVGGMSPEDHERRTRRLEETTSVLLGVGMPAVSKQTLQASAHYDKVEARRLFDEELKRINYALAEEMSKGGVEFDKKEIAKRRAEMIHQAELKYGVRLQEAQAKHEAGEEFGDEGGASAMGYAKFSKAMADSERRSAEAKARMAEQSAEHERQMAELKKKREATEAELAGNMEWLMSMTTQARGKQLGGSKK